MPKYWFRCGLAALILWCTAAIFTPALATTYYVRTDGGTATQCNGTADAKYPGSGNAQACAFNNPQWAIPPGYSNDGAKPKMKAGDTLIIGSGSYGLGYGTPGATACQTSYTYACDLQSTLPNNLTIEGQSCSAPPVLWGTGHVYALLTLSGTTGSTVKCLELTDHSNCIDNYSPTSNTGGVTACKTSYPAGDSAQMGIVINGASNVTLSSLNVHGFGTFGILAGKLTGTTTVSNVTLRANGWGGWSGDLGGNDQSSTDSGALNFDHLTVSYNGCAEAYPATTIVGCWGQNEGGYGDGFSESWTGGNWTFTNSTFANNTQDGLDMLYANGTGSVTMDKLTAWENAGNGIKTSGAASLTNSVVSGYCNNWKGFPVGGDGSSGVAGTMCRADGTAVVMEFTGPSQTITLAYNTVTGNGDTLFLSGGSDHDFNPVSSDVVTMSDNIWLGQTSVIPRDDGGYTGLDWYSDGTYNGKVVYTNNIVWHVKSNNCPAGSVCKDPLLANETLATFDADLLTGSPAIHVAKGGPSVSTDYYGNARANPTSIGAVEYGSTGSGGGSGSPPPIVPPRAPGNPHCKWKFCHRNRVMGSEGAASYPGAGSYHAPAPYTAPTQQLYTPRTPYQATVDRN